MDFEAGDVFEEDQLRLALEVAKLTNDVQKRLSAIVMVIFLLSWQSQFMKGNAITGASEWLTWRRQQPHRASAL